MTFNPLHWVYDIETYPNIFTACFIHPATDTIKRFEISTRQDDRQSLVAFILYLKAIDASGVGFNNEGFDYPVIHHTVGGADPYVEAMKIINSDERWGATIWDKLVAQIDLYKMNHFDNKAKSTGLKDLEIVMRSETVQDLPFPPGTILTHDQMDELHRYNEKDVRETVAFLAHNMKAIEFREQLTRDYGRDFMNFADTKIGAEIFITELERAGVQCYYRDSNNKRTPKQTWRSEIRINEILLPYIKLERPEFQLILSFFKSQIIHETKGSFAEIDVTDWPEEWLCPKEEWPSDFKIAINKNGRKIASSLHVRVEGIVYFFGTGGLHGAKPNRKYISNSIFKIEMRDVKSYYPNLANENIIFPEHLGPVFCKINKELYIKRANTPKSNPINGALKLALNGTYGNSNNKYSVFYDPKYTMTITINGQLGLCMLIEQLLKIPQLEMINVNTDGVGFIYPKEYSSHVDKVCEWWEQVTKLELEQEDYHKFFQRDVNSYIGVDPKGSVKRKGAYEYELEWHKNPSMLAVKKAVEAHLVHGVDVVAHLMGNRDPYDFMIRAKVNRNCQLFFGEHQTQRITRYFVANKGVEVVKVTPSKGVVGSWKLKRGVSVEAYERWCEVIVNELNVADSGGMLTLTQHEIVHDDGSTVPLDTLGIPYDPEWHTATKSKHADSRTRFEAGWQCVECANVVDFDWDNLNYAYYIEEAMKLIEVLK